ncbi:MAG: single-stranded DNA-binding protein [Verrucomicrobiota bacterium]|nr:single-stranded DNA-binding protein [Verrucomicrobiota bacterium]
MINEVTISGRITSQLELKHTINGKPLLNFTLGTNERRDEQEYTVWVDITAWNGIADDTAKNMRKGSPVLIHGHLSQSKWEEEGRNRSRLFVTAKSIEFLESAKAEARSSST